MASTAKSRPGIPACGFSVQATKKGELPLKIEKRARGKKVTVIPNVTGDATKLVRALQTLLGVGGTVRQAEQGVMNVEVQGEQVTRVSKALLDFHCLKGLTKEAAERFRKEHESTARQEVAVVATDATKFLRDTEAGKRLSPGEERKKMFGMETEFYLRFAGQSGMQGDDVSDVWEESLSGSSAVPRESPSEAMTVAEINTGFMALGMLAAEGREVKKFWEASGLTVERFRKMARASGSRLIDDAEKKQREVVTNLRSRAKNSTWKGGGRSTYFSCPVSAIDDYERGLTGAKAPATRSYNYEPESKFNVETDDEGWCAAALSYVAPFEVPESRLEEDERMAVAKNALADMSEDLSEDLQAVSVPGVEFRVDCETFGIDLHVTERTFLEQRAAAASAGKALDRSEKEIMALEKKLRDVVKLKERQSAGEKLEKTQLEKLARKVEIFTEIAELKLRRAETGLKKVCKKHGMRFKDRFWKLEWQALYPDDDGGDQLDASGGDASLGRFNPDARDAAVTLDPGGWHAQSKGAQWAGVELSLAIRDGEVGAFCVEVLDGLVRLGWLAEGGQRGDLGGDGRSFGFGGSGKKVHDGAFEAYGPAFKAGDQIHCEAEREDGQLRIGFAKNSEPLGVAFEVPDDFLGARPLTAAVCGKGFKLRLLSAEAVPLDEAPPLPSYEEFEPPRRAVAVKSFQEDDGELADSFLQVWKGETLYISADDGEGSLFGFFLDPEDGGWLPAHVVRLDDEDGLGPAPPTGAGWGTEAQPDDAAEVRGSAPVPGDDWSQAPASSSVARAGVQEKACEVVPGLGDWLRGLKLEKYEAKAIAWCEENGATELAEVEEFWEDFADALELSAAARAGAPEEASEVLPGLGDWLRGLKLEKYEAKAIAWCEENGATELAEVEEFWEDFADGLELKPLERKRLGKSLGAAM